MTTICTDRKRRWTIVNTTSGVSLGVYPGRTEREALDALAQSAGYRDFDDLKISLGEAARTDDLVVEEVAP